VPNSNLPARRSFGGLVRNKDRQVAEAVAEIHAEMFVERARDTAERDIALLRATDIGQVTRHSMAEAADIAACAAAYIDANPLAAKVVTQLGETGVRGLDRHLRQFTREG
jgi:ferritin-like protein